MLTNKMKNLFQINVLIQFLVSSTCFEHHVFIIIIIFNRRYNPWWVLACFTISFHNLLSLHFSLSSFSLSSSLTLLLLGQAISVLVFLLVLMSMVPIQLLFLTILVVSILFTCAAHRNLCDFINLTLFFFLN